MKSFEELKVSTRTIIATANVEMDTETIFKTIPIQEQWLNGEKMRIDVMYYKHEIRTTDETRRQEGKKQKSFRNALNVIMYVGDKKVNFKVSKNGKFQLTGCKEIRHAKMAVFSFLETVNATCPRAFIAQPRYFRVYMEIVMTNMDCCAGYCINRQMLDRIINTETPFHSLLETSFGYTGVNIKFPVQTDLASLQIPLFEWECGRPETIQDKTMSMSLVLKEKMPVKYNTFLVFHSGQFIMSGMFEDTMRDDYNRFLSILNENESSVREILDL